tara:strand:+ start:664 stop:1047 length:384 start_codon:yes stop_codon:yes gene_type:complete
MLRIGDLLTGTPVLKPEINWFQVQGLEPGYDYYEDLLEMPLEGPAIIADVLGSEIKIHGDILDMCLSRSCLVIEETVIIVNENREELCRLLCNTMVAENTYEWKDLWVKKSILQFVLDNYPQYLQKL